MSEYVRKQALVEWLDESIQTLRGLAIGFRNQGNELAERGCHRDADGLYVIMKKIQSGAFDAPDGEVQRLRAENERYRKALERIAETDIPYAPMTDHSVIRFYEQVAREALASTPTEPNELRRMKR